MIESGDLSLPSRVQVADGYRRPLRRLFRRTATWRTVHLGYINHVERSYRGTSVVIEDGMSRLARERLAV